MTPPVWLIAEREFRAYAATLSFWVALAVGPLVMAGAFALTTAAPSAPKPVHVAVESHDPALAAAAAAALEEAGRLEGKSLAVSSNARLGAARLIVGRLPNGDIDARLTGPWPLSASGRALVARTLERDEALRRAGEHGAAAAAPVARIAAERPAPKAADTAAFARFAMVMVLWLTLTGSLGMLLQAVVRERANRALESLLAASTAKDIVYGKLLGVGAVSALVLVAWLGSAAALAPLTPHATGLTGGLLKGLAEPVTLARAGAIYVLAFAFYGLVTIAVGAAARDSAAAQNLSRPMFAVLLAAFFAALVASGGGGAALAWLVYLPPFTPFMLLLQPAGAGSPVADLIALGLLFTATLLAARWAVRALSIAPATPWRGRRSTDRADAGAQAAALPSA